MIAHGIDVTDRYAVLPTACKRPKGRACQTASFALDEHGRSRFQLAQNALNKKAKLLCVVFGLLFAGGEDIRQSPLLERKKFLKTLLRRDPLQRDSASLQGAANAQGRRIAERAAGLHHWGKRTREGCLAFVTDRARSLPSSTIREMPPRQVTTRQAGVK